MSIVQQFTFLKKKKKVEKYILGRNLKISKW